MKSSLKYKLVLPYILLILLLSVVLGWLSWWANSKTVSNLTEQLMVEITQRIGQAVDRHMFGTGAVLETAFPDGMYAPEDIASQQQAMITRFYTAASIFTDPSDYVYYGNELGQGLGVQKLVDGSAQIRIKLRAQDPRDFLLIHSINGTPEHRFTEDSIFDPRSRIWYQLGRDAERHTWTAVYLDYGTKQLVVTRARKVMGQDGEFAGVVATDLFLSELSRFVSQLPITQGSRAFIVEPGGELIAASSVANVRTDENGKAVRVTAVDSGDNMIGQAWASMSAVLQQQQLSDQQVHLLEFTDQQQQQVYLAVKHVQDDAGLSWYAVVAVPANDILGDVRSNSMLVVAIGMLALLMALGFGWVVFGRVAADIAQLSAAVKSTGRNLTDVSAQANRSDEIGVLARSFTQMRTELFTDRLTGVANRMALEYMLQDLLAERKESRQPFVLLFLDLNKFKPLNDTYGHDKGDLALIETARRIRAILREEDLVARLGGDEFVVVLRNGQNRQELSALIERLQDVVSQPLEFCDNFNLGVSIGAAVFPEHGSDSDSLLKHADAQMYAAKERSR